MRGIAKCFARNLVLTQRFHGGQIAFNAVVHSWAWTGGRTYESFDRDLQDRLLALSLERSYLIDIGANVGAMALSVLLRNPEARALAVEPGADAVRLLRESLRLNRLEGRCEILETAASAGEERLGFEPANSVLAHVSEGGPGVAATSLLEIVRRADNGRPFLMKVDVEGYESALLPSLRRIDAAKGTCAVVELHPAGFNGLGDPQRCLGLLKADNRLGVRALGGAPLERVDSSQFTQIEVLWL